MRDKDQYEKQRLSPQSWGIAGDDCQGKGPVVTLKAVPGYTFIARTTRRVP